MIGERLRRLREAANLNLREVGEHFGITPQGVYNLEHKQAWPLCERLREMCALYGASLQDLFQEEEDSSESVLLVEVKDNRILLHPSGRIDLVNPEGIKTLGKLRLVFDPSPD